jgi:hypothetical protein
VVLIILLFVGCKWVKPQILRPRVWNCLEFEMRNLDEPEPPNVPSNARDLGSLLTFSGRHLLEE